MIKGVAGDPVFNSHLLMKAVIDSRILKIIQNAPDLSHLHVIILTVIDQDVGTRLTTRLKSWGNDVLTKTTNRLFD